MVAAPLPSYYPRMLERRVRVVLAGFSALVSFGLPAQAALTYTAPAACPSHSDFVSAVAERGVDVETAQKSSGMPLALSVTRVDSVKSTPRPWRRWTIARRSVSTPQGNGREDVDRPQRQE